MKYRKSIILILLILVSLSVGGTLSYWTPQVNIETKKVNTSIHVGTWNFEEVIENFGFVNFFEDIVFQNSKHPYQTFIKGEEPSMYEVIVVYYPPTDLFYKLDLLKNPSACFPYNSNTGCKKPDISDPYNNPYEHLQLEYLNNIKYEPKSDVHYNGKYYTKVDNNQSAPLEAGYDNWLVVETGYEKDYFYAVGDRIVFNEQLFIANQAGILSHPQNYTGEWNLKTYEYVSSNIYRYHDVVKYQGKFYYLTSETSQYVAPETSDVWKLAG